MIKSNNSVVATFSRVSPGKKWSIPLWWSLLMNLGESPATLQTGTKCPLMSLWMTSGWASHWGSTRWTCQHDPAKHVNTSLTEHCEVLSDHCTFCTGLLSNPPRTVNPVSSVCFGISSFDSTSSCSWRSSPLTPEFLRPSVDVTKIHKPNLSKLFLQLYNSLDVTLMYILPFE